MRDLPDVMDKSIAAVKIMMLVRNGFLFAVRVDDVLVMRYPQDVLFRANHMHAVAMRPVVLGASLNNPYFPGLRHVPRYLEPAPAIVCHSPRSFLKPVKMPFKPRATAQCSDAPSDKLLGGLA